MAVLAGQFFDADCPAVGRSLSALAQIGLSRLTPADADTRSNDRRIRTIPLATADPLGAGPEPVTPESFFSAINHVTLKVTNGCNLKCSYCNVEVEPVSAPRMPMLVFKRAADLLIQNSRYSHVGLEFHGGEPLLLEDEWFGKPSLRVPT